MKKLDFDENKLRQLHSDDVTLRDIAEYFGCDRTTIDRRCRKLGLLKKRTGPKSGDKHTGWKGGVVVSGGYRYIYSPNHPNKTKAGYVLEHRLAMERKLERYLVRLEVVHHRDGDKSNNHIDNLEVFQSNGEHLKYELTGRVPKWSPEGYKRMVEASRKYRSQKRNQTE